ncbi:MAG: hypothetical protein ACK4RK_08650, partial [Gemmataceae bacterium]
MLGLLLLGGANSASAQPVPPRLPPPPSCAPSPLLYVRFVGGPGVHVTFYQGATRPRDFPVPVQVGMRPGYCYPVRLTQLPGWPEVDLYPTLEVVGTLKLPCQCKASDFPVNVVLDADDIAQVLAGAYITKVYVLEDPHHAAAYATSKDRPLEVTVQRSDQVFQEAQAIGRPMLILRLGQRRASAEELAAQSFPGTILLPGEKVLGPAAQPPRLTWYSWPLVDPFWGPKGVTGEVIHDGGDCPPFAALTLDGQLYGLNPTDTLAEYADSKGRKHVAKSNRVCICAPRFVAARTQVVPIGYDNVVIVSRKEKIQGQELLDQNIPSLLTQRNEQLEAVRGRLRPSANISRCVPGRIETLDVLEAYVMDLGPAHALCTKELRQ